MTTPVKALRHALRHALRPAHRPERERRVWITGCMAVVMLAVSEAKAQSSGLITRTSRYSLDETLQRLERAAAERGLAVFARLDPRGARPGHLLVLGGPDGGTPVVQAAPSATLDLPLKVLVAEAADGGTEVSIDDRAWLAQQAGMPSVLASNVAALPGVIEAALQ